ISAVSPTVSLVLKRPKYADGRFKELTKLHETDINAIDHFDPRTHFWGADGITREFLESAVNCIKGESAHQNIYNSSDDQYLIPIDVALFQDRFKNTEITEQFRLLDNLKTLGMLTSIEVGLTIQGNQPATLNHFSDGQFQSVYIYAITELFKDKECLTLLDEPDSFLHPEWQFEFLRQISDITIEAAQSNHILMTSHSAATLCNIEQAQLSQMKFLNEQIECIPVDKRNVINDLSNSFIQYSEDESKLLIDNVIRTSLRPILFVEGPSDVNVLNTAYEKLYPGEDIPILIQDAFDRGFIKTLLARGEIHQAYPDKLFFALFDFDDAYEDWRHLGGNMEVTDIGLGLCRKLEDRNAYSFLLPIPNNAIREQVWDEDNPLEKILPNPHFCIEHAFWGITELEKYFGPHRKKDYIVFKGDKIKFSKEVISQLPSECFELFRPMFEFIQGKIQSHTELAKAS
ncbi:AAA family ATPase, partial [Pseudoalteromonas peptidolytica]|uniref:AAA family ATPase n=1 Tax=Pseudoalteromonas peptidolytica TaxID=61150 RepID=UPI00142ED566